MKTDVYSWRLSPARKAALEDAARAERTSIGELLDRATDAWIAGRRRRAGADEDEQTRLHAAAMRFIGLCQGGDAELSRQVRERVKARLARRRAR